MQLCVKWSILPYSQPQGNYILLIYKYSMVSFCDGSFYDDPLLRPLSSRTEHSRLEVHHCSNSSVLSVLSALLDLFPCANVSSFSILVQFFWVYCDFPTHDVHQKDRKEEKNQNSWRYILSWCLLDHGLGLLQQNKKWFDWYFLQLSV
jgi:hypothetical protein